LSVSTLSQKQKIIKNQHRIGQKGLLKTAVEKGIGGKEYTSADKTYLCIGQKPYQCFSHAFSLFWRNILFLVTPIPLLSYKYYKPPQKARSFPEAGCVTSQE
jgi:hypothetical protein